MTAPFGRVVTAMVTPFRDDLSLNYDRAAELALALMESGSDGVVVAGTTGESPTITMQEQAQLFRVVRDAAGTKGCVIGGAGQNSTEESLELARNAQQAGCDALLLVAPYYNRPSQEGMYQHFKSVAERVDLPIVLYNIPGRCSVNIEPATTERLAQIPNIVAIKEACGSLDQITDVAVRLRRARPDFAVYSGDDSLTLPVLSVGGAGVVSVASHLTGRQIQAMIRDYLEGRVEQAAERNAKLHGFFKSLFITTNPVPIKAALRLAGWDCGGVRLPLVDANESEIARIRAAMDALEEGVDIAPPSAEV